MRLLNSQTLEFQDFLGAVPSYAILSHRWGDDEVSFREFAKGRRKIGPGYQKIINCCRLATGRGIEWTWIDTCCIDKRSSAELTEAINSMFKWYRNSTVCFVLLPDVIHEELLHPMDVEAFARSSWFSRGWTLQELLAPKNVEFYSASLELLGDKVSLSIAISKATRIDENVLLGERDLSTVTVAERMSWASCRQTTRDEDMAYCLLGLFDVNMPLLYGEGSKAFMRLQLEILRKSDDQSIFVWQTNETPPQHDLCLLADSPASFKDFASIRPYDLALLGETRHRLPYSMTNKGLEMQLPLPPLPRRHVFGPQHDAILLVLNCLLHEHSNGNEARPVALMLRRSSDSSLVWCVERRVIGRFDSEGFDFGHHSVSGVVLIGLDNLSMLLEDEDELTADEITEDETTKNESKPLHLWFPLDAPWQKYSDEGGFVTQRIYVPQAGL